MIYFSSRFSLKIIPERVSANQQMSACRLDRVNCLALDLPKKRARAAGGKADRFVERQQTRFFRAARTKTPNIAAAAHAHDKYFMAFGRDQNFL